MSIGSEFFTDIYKLPKYIKAMWDKLPLKTRKRIENEVVKYIKALIKEKFALTKNEGID